MRRNAHTECPDSLNGLHEVSEVEVESTNEDSTSVLITCVHCEAVGKMEIQYPDIEWKKEADEEEEDEEDEDEDDEDDDPLRRAEDED